MSNDTKKHPYSSLPNSSFWRRSVSGVDFADIDPIVRKDLEIGRSDKIATAGSCFAQHLARRLRASGYNYFVTEPGHSMVSPEDLREYNYGTFSARYGNIYTTTQLLQLFERVYGEFAPLDQYWEEPNGSFIDPYRPRIQPGGFSCLDELLADREYHFRAVRRAFEEADVFIFTLGLTESWVNARDGAVYPLCPGVAGGVFDDREHRFVNLDVAAVAGALNRFIERLRSVNNEVKIVLTVSPVPLIATAETGQHVLVANTYSKSVLRAAAGEAAGRCSRVAYFPSYELISAHANDGRYYDADKREVNDAGIDHVMRVFFKNYCVSEGQSALSSVTASSRDGSSRPDGVAAGTPHGHGMASRDAQFLKNMEEAMETECDELALEGTADYPGERSEGRDSSEPAGRTHPSLWRNLVRRLRDSK